MLNCNCNNDCANVIRITSTSSSGGSFFFVSPNTITPVNNGRYVLKCPASLLPVEAITTIEQVYITLGTTNIPLQCKLGNNVYTDQIRCFNKDNCCNLVLRLAYGSTPSHFKIISQDLCCSQAYGLIATPETTNTGSKTTTKKTTAEKGE